MVAEVMVEETQEDLDQTMGSDQQEEEASQAVELEALVVPVAALATGVVLKLVMMGEAGVEVTMGEVVQVVEVAVVAEDQAMQLEQLPQILKVTKAAMVLLPYL